MNEEEFDAATNWKPFGSQNAIRMDEQSGRATRLGIALFGKTIEYLKGQLLASHPELPAGFELDDYRRLERSVQVVAAGLRGHPHPLFKWARGSSLSSRVIQVGRRQYSEWEVRCVVVRRAIEFLERG